MTINRRQGLSILALSPLVVASKLAAATDVTPPSALGCGFLSTANIVKQPVFPARNPNEFSFEDDAGIDFDVHEMQNRSEFSKAVTASASGKFGWGGGSGSFSAQLAQSFRTDDLKLTLVLSKSVRIKRFYMINPTWSPEMIDTYNGGSDVDLFLKFGNEFVQSVHTGGKMLLIYDLTFKSIEDKSSFVISAGYKDATAKLDASFSQKMENLTRNIDVKVQGAITGAISAPGIFTSGDGGGIDAPGSHTPSLGLEDKQSTELFDYFNKFEKLVQSVENHTVMQIQTKSIFDAAGSLKPRMDLHATTKTIDRGTRLDDIIDERRAKAKLMRDSARTWNPQVSNDAPSELIEIYDKLQEELEEQLYYVAMLQKESNTLTIRDATRTDVTPLPENTIPRLPKNWKIKPLVLKSKDQHFSRRVETFKRSFEETVYIPLPEHVDEEPAHVFISVGYDPLVPPYAPGHVAMITLTWCDSEKEPIMDGKGKPITIYDLVMNSDYAGSQKRDDIVLMKEKYAFISLRQSAHYVTSGVTVDVLT